MFTVKLFLDGELKRITRADSINFGSAQPEAVRQMTLYRNDGTEEVYLVGPRMGATIPLSNDFNYYHRAIIENAAGKTTEIVNPAGVRRVA